MSFPNLQLTGTTSQFYPVGAVRDQYESSWEYKPDPDGADDNDVLQRRVRTLTFHVDVNSASTVSTAAALYVAQENIDTPKMKVRTPAGASVNMVYNGTWQVDRVSVQDNGNGTSRIITSCRLETDWAQVTQGGDT